MCVGRQGAWRIFQDYICTDSAVGAVGMESDAFLQKFSTVLQSCDLVVEPLIRQLLFKQKYLFLCGFMATLDMGTI